LYTSIFNRYWWWKVRFRNHHRWWLKPLVGNHQKIYNCQVAPNQHHCKIDLFLNSYLSLNPLKNVIASSRRARPSQYPPSGKLQEIFYSGTTLVPELYKDVG